MSLPQALLCLAAVGVVCSSALPSPGLLGHAGHGGHAQSYVSFDGHHGGLAQLSPAPVHLGPALNHGHDYDHHAPEPAAPAKYAFKYGVHDAHTGDVKDQSEHRDGDVVKGEYSLLQPDGTKRTVHYTADHHSGFNAVVSYSGHAAHPKAVHAPAVVHAAPAVVHAAPSFDHGYAVGGHGHGGHGAATSYVSGGLIAYAVGPEGVHGVHGGHH